VSKQSLQITNRKLSNFDEISVISFLIQISRRLNALSTQFHTSNVAHANFSVETIPANRKRNLSNFDQNSVISFPIEMSRRLNALSTPFYTTSVAHANFSVETIPANRKRNLSNFGENSDTSILIAISRRFNGLSNRFYTRNVAHANFSVETIPVNPKTQTFKFRRNLCYFIPDRDTLAFKRSFHSILHSERSARQFQRRNNPCKSQNAYFQISEKTLLFRS
jgi:hypothetical protein